MKAAIAVLIAVIISAVPSAFGHSGHSFPAIVQECNDLGISADKCTEEAILHKRFIGGPGTRDGDQSRVEANIALIPIYAGIAVAFAAGVLYVRRTKDSRKPRQSH